MRRAGLPQRPSAAGVLGDLVERVTRLEFRTTNATNVAHASFSAAEIEAGATKVLVPAVGGTIVIPLDFFLVPSADFNWTEDVPGASSLGIRAGVGVWNWDAFAFQGFGVTQWTSLANMAGDPSTDGIPRVIIGEDLNAVVGNGSGLAVTDGNFEVFARWYRTRITT